MFTFTSIEVVKSVGCRRISHLICGSFVRKYSPLVVEKSCDSQPSELSRIQKYPLSLRCPHVVLKTSGMHWLPTGRSSGSANFLISYRHYQTKSKDYNKEDDDNSESESKAKNVLDDLEFQSILKDFAKDFGVDEDTSQLLEEIKQSHHSMLHEETEQPLSKAASSEHQLDSKNGIESRTDNLPLSEHKLQGLSDHDSPGVSDFEEDSADEFFHIDQELEKSVEYDAIRGKEGVFDIDQLVPVLKEENLIDISVVQVPHVFHYADYLVLATAKSPRHCNAVIEFLIKLYKKKKNKEDPFIKCEGESTTTWKALDMGNIVLHVFLQDTRNFYDIESLWLLDRKYDSAGGVKSDPELDMMQAQLDFLKTLNPH